MTLLTYQGLHRPTSAAHHRSPLGTRRLPRRLPRWRAVTCVALGLAASAAVPAHSSATAPTRSPNALTYARTLRAEVNARYRLLPGRKLVVTEASRMGIPMLSLMANDLLDGRVVPADDGIYFAICSARARCPYHGRRAEWGVSAFMPRRQALELALRTFLETTASLVVVSLPTAQPVWVVFERDDVVASIDVPAVLDRLASSPSIVDRSLRELVLTLTRSRLTAPLAIGPDDSIVAVRLFAS